MSVCPWEGSERRLHACGHAWARACKSMEMRLSASIYAPCGADACVCAGLCVPVFDGKHMHCVCICADEYVSFLYIRVCGSVYVQAHMQVTFCLSAFYALTRVLMSQETHVN